MRGQIVGRTDDSDLGRRTQLPPDFKPDTSYLDQALREFNRDRRWNLHGVVSGEDLRFDELLPEEQNQVLARAQQLKAEATRAH